MAKFAVILAAAGRSTRFANSGKKKPFVDLNGRAVWLRAAEPFLAHADVAQVVMVVSPEDLDSFKERFRPNLAFMDIEIVTGGAERADSVQNALKQINTSMDYIAVHDAARPLICTDWIDAVFKAAEQSGAAIPATPIRGTIKRVAEQTISETIDRRGLWEAQTPQVFRRELLIDAYANRGDFVATDEAQLVERHGHPVTIVEGSPVNIKITTQADLRIARALLEVVPGRKSQRPLHPFADDPKDLFS